MDRSLQHAFPFIGNLQQILATPSIDDWHQKSYCDSIEKYASFHNDDFLIINILDIISLWIHSNETYTIVIARFWNDFSFPQAQLCYYNATSILSKSHTENITVTLIKSIDFVWFANYKLSTIANTKLHKTHKYQYNIFSFRFLKHKWSRHPWPDSSSLNQIKSENDDDDDREYQFKNVSHQRRHCTITII